MELPMDLAEGKGRAQGVTCREASVLRTPGGTLLGLLTLSVLPQVPTTV